MVRTKIKPKVESSYKTILDLGCGQNKAVLEDVYQIDANGNKVLVKQGLLSTPLLQAGDNGNVRIKGVDFVDIEGVDIVHDLTKFPYPFKDNSIDGIYSSHFVEHLDGFERAKFMDECYRILKPAGKMRLIHPYYKSVRAVQDFSHKWPPISEHSYFYWDKNWREANKLTHGNYNLKCDYEFAVYYTWQDGTVAMKNEETQRFWIDKYMNVVGDMIVDLKKR